MPSADTCAPSQQSPAVLLTEGPGSLYPTYVLLHKWSKADSESSSWDVLEMDPNLGLSSWLLSEVSLALCREL